MSLPQASPASPSQSQEKERRRPTKETSGLKLSSAFALYDHDMRIWKTSQACLLQIISDEFTETWPKQGMMQNGVCWELTMWEPTIGGKGGGLWLPTPNAQEPVDKVKIDHYIETGELRYSPFGYKQPRRLMLAESVEVKERTGLWPTPSAELAGEGPLLDELETKEGTPAQPGERAYNPKTGKHVQITLNRAVRMWPTPCVGDIIPRKGGLRPSRIKTGRKTGYLSEEVKRWPTPQLDDAKNVYPSDKRRKTLVKDVGGGQLNPDWVEWLMGWPIGWTDLKPLGMDRFREWLKKHGRF